MYLNVFLNILFSLSLILNFSFEKKSGLGTEYFRTLVQSNCGVSVLDFTPHAEGGSPYICLNRLNQVLKKIINNFLHCRYEEVCGKDLEKCEDNLSLSPLNRIAILVQTPSSPIAAGSSGGRNTSKRIILVCHGSTQINAEVHKMIIKAALQCVCLYLYKFFESKDWLNLTSGWVVKGLKEAILLRSSLQFVESCELLFKLKVYPGWW